MDLLFFINVLKQAFHGFTCILCSIPVIHMPFVNIIQQMNQESKHVNKHNDDDDDGDLHSGVL